MTKKSISIILSLVLVSVSITACGNKGNSQSASSDVSATAEKSKNTNKIITDSAGKQVKIPEKINNIAELWGAHIEVLHTLGAGDKIVTTTFTPQSRPWLFKVIPTLDKAVYSVIANLNVEQVLSKKPDIVFIPTGDKNVKQLTQMGLPVVELSFTDFESMKKCFTLTGEILGGDAVKKAQNYNSYLDSKLNMIKSITSKIQDDQKPKVLHLSNSAPFAADGDKTIINDWIEVAGGKNAASEVTGNRKEVSVEQILKWNPDIIIVSENIKSIDKITGDTRLANVSAVKNDKVFLNPDGAFLWNRYGTEEALQVQWAAKTIQPDKFQTLDIAKETKSFYKTFLNYDLTDNDVQKILNAQAP
ncbi:ABC transporter substrate-binding protein [Clostridium sp. DJ247]|uniref:ABC transporter substrate-binding protein n=1 Tax=Clostridium sp. DJ247 TaxID=2726188 RepID=UPI0016242F54|nr:ABC transporter substrate-binding protein [Clostridium sp. DJ247]MBC2582694.1 ABC transporter substrate-binding protein [Clostridium sp. DJ247]